MPHFTTNWNLPYDDPQDLPGLAETGGPTGAHDILAVILDDILTTINDGTETVTNEFNTFASTLDHTRNIETFSTDGTWTPNPDAGQYRIRAMGGGGAGGGASATGSNNNYSLGTGGASGSTLSLLINADELTNTSYAVTIGQGGTPNSGGTGGTGGTTSINNILSCPGGSGGTVLDHTDTLTLVDIAGILVVQTPTEPDSQSGVQGPGTPTHSLGTQIIASPGSPSEGTWVHPPTGMAGTGASTIIGGGGVGHRFTLSDSETHSGDNGTGTGAGGGGALSRGPASALAGGAGTDGIVVIESFITEGSMS